MLVSVLNKQKALDLLLDDKINQEDYDGLVVILNPVIEELVEQLNLLQYKESKRKSRRFRDALSHF